MLSGVADRRCWSLSYLIARFTKKMGEACSSNCLGLKAPKAPKRKARPTRGRPPHGDGISSFFNWSYMSLFDIRIRFGDHVVTPVLGFSANIPLRDRSRHTVLGRRFLDDTGRPLTVYVRLCFFSLGVFFSSSWGFLIGSFRGGPDHPAPSVRRRATVSRQGRRLRRSRPRANHVAFAPSAILGERAFHRVIAGHRYPTEAIAAGGPQTKSRHDAASAARSRSQRVGITVTADFDEVAARGRRKDAGYRAGLEVIGHHTSPTARRRRFGFKQGFLNKARRGREARERRSSLRYGGGRSTDP